MRFLLYMAVAAAALGVPTLATAETRYASPNGTGFVCTQAVPCDIKVALMDDRAGDAGVDAGDSVELQEGVYLGRSDADPTTYSPGDELRIARSIDVYGATTGVSLSKGARIFVSHRYGLVLGAPGVQLRDVLLWGTSTNTVSALTVAGSGTRITRVFASSPGDIGCMFSLDGDNTLVTYVLCRGGKGVSIAAGESGSRRQRLRNLTAIALGQNMPGIDAATTGTASGTIELANVIARGAGTGQDIRATAFDSSRLSIVAATSNYRSRAEAGRNASVTAPNSNLNTSVDPGFGYYSFWADEYYRLGPDSPLIDAGSQLQTGSTTYDLFGTVASIGQRSVGAYDVNPGLSPPSPGTAGPPEEIQNEIGGAPGATVTPPADPGQQAGGGGAETASVALPRPRAKVRRAGVAIISRVTVPGAGTITQRIAVRKGKRLRGLCTARIDVLQAGSTRVVCQLGRKTRTALRNRTQRLVITTTFATADSTAKKVHRLTVKRRR